MQDKRLSYLAGLILLSCGSAPPVLPPEILTGPYRAYANESHANDECQIPDDKDLWMDVEFTAEGQLQSPFPGVNCKIEYPLYITCNGYGASLRAWKEFTGTSGYIYGRGEATGNLFGCTEVQFDFRLKKL